MSIYDYTVKTTKGEMKSIGDYKGKVMLIVNTASKCGFTPQYKELQALYLQYKDSGLEILGFPCNQFGRGEQGSNEDIQSFCEINFGVTFPLFDKIDVNGANAAPLYKYLKKEATGILGSESIKWNFTKFLVDSEGHVLKRYGSADKPSAVEKDLEGLLTGLI
ncbi:MULTISPECIES: glutathione peroxidase [Paenibacillus]|uniref:Glutathione peroxidase n=1 Tax=Paenibacillus baimaensis TaxID=2982185 RepID=A0ABT2U8U9_9BACL|nr:MULTISPECIES: glutathione peroxidase [unclassified Paenibacillus]MCU6791059.1 glutathione peroxidase [Paenibacillus sp. WQ 127069]OMF19175.1 glutathione peroxidase [Paenibacillus sp. FSL H7-0331]